MTREIAHWLSAALVVAAVGCVARAQPPDVPPVVVLHAFTGGDGSTPLAPLLAVGNDFYGTTSLGGLWGRGSIFRVSRSGAFTSLYSFLGLGDGGQPQRLVLGPDGGIYGTTAAISRTGQADIWGTFFHIAPSGELTTLFVFRGLQDGYRPGPVTVARDRFFYGSTETGGANGYGTAFRLTTRGELTVLRDFVDFETVFGPFVQGTDDNLYAPGGGFIERMTLSGDMSLVAGGGIALPFLLAGRDGRIYGSGINGFPCDNGNVFSFTPAGDLRSGPIVKSPDLDICGGFRLDFQAADLTIFGTFNTRVVRVTPLGDVPEPAAYPRLPGAWLTDGGDGNAYGVTSGDQVADFGSIFKMSTLGTPKPPTNVRLTPG